LRTEEKVEVPERLPGLLYLTGRLTAIHVPSNEDQSERRGGDWAWARKLPPSTPRRKCKRSRHLDFGLTQERDGAKELGNQARHSRVAAGAIEPPGLAHRIPVVALVGDTKSGSGVLG
jgi:hypothetical protein